MNYQPQWTIEDGKLYLVNIDLLGIMTKGASCDEKEEETQIMTEEDGTTRELRVRSTKIIQPFDGISTMQKIFGEDKLFADWVDEPMKLLVKESKQKPVIVNKSKSNERTRYEVTMDLLILDIKKGVLISSESKQETYLTVKNYIEEGGG